MLEHIGETLLGIVGWETVLCADTGLCREAVVAVALSTPRQGVDISSEEVTVGNF